MKLLVLGLGYSARHSVDVLRPALVELVGTTRSEDRLSRLEAIGARPILYDGSEMSGRLAAVIDDASHILVSAGPDEAGDPFLRRHAADILDAARSGTLGWIGYYSTVGVYGDTGGAWVDETTPPAPASDRTRWRVAAEDAWREIGAAAGVPVAIMRLAGIYGPGRNAFVHLSRGTAKRIVRPGQVFNRIHVADIGRLTAAAVSLRADGVFNFTDDEPAPPQDPIAFASRLMGVEPPPEVPFESVAMSPMARTFWGENKRVGNRRLAELGVPLVYPSYREGLTALWTSGTWEGSEEDREEASPRFKRIAG